jgi:hypothetical protein
VKFARLKHYWDNGSILAVCLIVMLALLGGSSRADAMSVIILRPLSAVFLAVALLRMTPAHLRAHRALWMFAAAAIICIFIQLVPLPPSLWQALPGREPLIEIARATGTDQIWRPITMVPWTTWNAAYSLLPILAMLALLTTLGRETDRLILFLIAGVAVASGSLGFLQAISERNGGKRLVCQS